MMSDSATNNERVVVGIDLGGTKVLAAAITESGQILGRAKKKTKAQRTAEDILVRMAECCQGAVQAAGLTLEQVEGIGVGSPGPLDPIQGIVLHTPNLNLTNAPIVPYLQEKLNKPAFLDNDVNVGTLGEFVYGVGHGKQDVVGIFLGTGIGGGVIINGRLLHGKSFNAGEIGHMKVRAGGAKCGCGQKGCLEAYASKTALIRRFKKAVSKGKQTVLTSLLGNDWTRLTSNVFLEAYTSHDELVVTEIHRAAKYTGIAAGSLINILSPEMIIIGGGMMLAFGDKILEIIRQHARKNSFEMIFETVEIVQGTLGDDAGILGAAALAFQKLSIS